MSTAAIEESLVRASAALLRKMGATEVFIFGSAARGAVGSNSDVDIAVSGLPANVYFSAVSQVSDILGRPADLVDLDDPTPIVQYLRRSGDLVRVW